MKNYIKLSILLTFILFLFVQLNPAKADGVFLDCKSPLSAITFKTSGFTGAYSTALTASLNHWSTIPQVSVGISSSSTHTLTASSYSDTWYGLNTMSCTGGNLIKSAIKINTRTIDKDASTLEKTLFAQSTITHEIAHSFGLDDNPTPSNPNNSIMNHGRTRTSIYNLTSYDKVNIDLLY